MVHLMNETNEISLIFTKILEERYKGFDLDSSLFRLESIISSNNSNAKYRQVVIDNVLNIAKRDFEFYVRIMNWTIQNSTICLSYFFMKSALKQIRKESDGNVDKLFSIGDNCLWTQLFYNCIRVIVNNRLIGEVDISVSAENILIGKESKSIVPTTYLEKNKVQILDLLHDKYVQILIDSESEPNDIELSNSISKLNRVYQYYTDFKIYDVIDMVYSQDNAEQYLLENNLKPNRYDELLFEKHGLLLFPLIKSIKVKDGKLSISNEGYGSLANCKFSINYNGKSIFNKEIEIKNDGTYDICIEDELKSEIQNIDSNDKIDFCFLFQKFNRTYRFSISKEVWDIKESLSKKGNGNMNTNYITNYGNMAVGNNASISNSTGVKIDLNNEEMQELIVKLGTIIENVDNLDIETSKKIQIKSKIEQALDETKKINADISLINNLIRESGILFLNVSQIPVLVGAVVYIKTLLGF